MIYTEKPKKIRVMLTPFRDGLQSSFGGKVRREDYLPAMEFAGGESKHKRCAEGEGSACAPYAFGRPGGTETTGAREPG